MSNFARVIHHIDMKDVKRKRLGEIAAKKLKEERDKKEKELIKEISRITNQTGKLSYLKR